MKLMNEYLEFIKIGLLITLVYQLGSLKRIMTQNFPSLNSSGPMAGPTVNVNIDRDGILRNEDDIKNEDSETKEPSSEEKSAESVENTAAEENDDAEPEVDPGAPSEEALQRAKEREQLAEELRRKNERKTNDNNSKASSSSSSGLNIAKCSDCGAENTSMRQNCFNCGKKL